MATGKIGRKIALLLATVICTGAVTVNAIDAPQQAKIIKKRVQESPMRFDITDITSKPDDEIVRIGGNLTGTPHTSQRIDSISIIHNDVPLKAVDIDGVDFERYFQWEDDGNIYIEIDFPYFQVSGEGKDCLAGSTIVFHTVKGDVTTVVGKRLVVTGGR